MRSLTQSHSFWQKREENKKGTEQPSLSRSLANGADAQLSLVFSGPGTLPGISMDFLAGPRPCPCWQVSSQRQFLQSNAVQGAPAETDQAPERLGLLLRAFRTGTAMLGPQKPTLRVGGGELLCYMERLSPLSENKDLPLGMPTSDLCLSSSTDRAGAQGGQVALFGITDIALRCSGTLKMTLSQPGQAHPATIVSCLIRRGSPAL